MNIHTRLPLKSKSPVRADQIDLDDPAIFVFASWSRALVGAKPENELRIFGAMAEDAVTYLHARRQRVVDDLWLVAEEIGLVKLVGAANVQAAIAVAFDRGAT